jgi:hypothetical protein
MKKIFSAIVVTVFALALAFTPARAVNRVVTACPGSVVLWSAGAAGVDELVDIYGNKCVASQSDPVETPVTNSAVGTTAALPATLAGVASKTTYICGFSYKSSADVAVLGNLTVVGVISGTMNFRHITTINQTSLTDIGATEQNFYPCLPASAVNTAIVVTGPAPGTNGSNTISVWGFQK